MPSSSDSDSSSTTSTEKGVADYLIKKPTQAASSIQTKKFLQKIEQEPQNPLRWLEMAVFLARRGQDEERTERYFKRAILVDPDYSRAYSHYEKVHKDQERAEEMYQQACEVAGRTMNNDAGSFCKYAVFLEQVRRNIPAAEEYYKKATVANPLHANSLGNHGLFLLKAKKDVIMAEQYLLRASKAEDEKDNHWKTIYSQFVQAQQKRM